MREAKVDRHPSRFFLREAVGVRTGQRFDEGALAVIHMARGSDDEMLEAGHQQLFSKYLNEFVAAIRRPTRCESR
jgi:hypothetical protein